jgi:thiol-disulfide isomerase/thioredoxin
MGLTPEVDSLFHKFISGYPASIYREPLQTQVNKWLIVSPGRYAPDFTGTTVEGKSLSLSDLKGKVVYIDVWATWCGPCREEFPFSKKLQKKFEGNNKIVFLFVSVDRDMGAWKKMVINDKAWKGVHINQREISELYLIHGIPRYILIDAQGKIVKANAPRPSSNELEGEILELLKKK